ncbi:hypothetical protein BJ138DRAFT_1138781 [Hygrophoropsis aurantiaca]|uniref:Uncharacterized protein n=1 Tax=Hygrophoropsis aurantiaca TaxID=72124 RepID=A0ACB7ZR50_9AGAM|nr:hypothetical protein BJ138DRAFT_1138781 [Hygrophoropsis aurantiaca]
MHLLWENVIKNLILLWTGEYKGIDPGCEAYELERDVWAAICKATATSGKTIPSVYCARPPNPDTERTMCTADSWSFWTQYLGPVLLQQKFSKMKYYKHFVKLVKMIRVCLQFELSKTDVQDLRTGFVSWINEFEEIYYQHELQRLATCTLTIHALAHIADSIEDSGPVWTSWAFPMERFCGRLQAAIKNPTCVLLPPRRQGVGAVEISHVNKIFKALATRFGVPLATIKRHITAGQIEQWGKVRRLDGGDTMLAAGLVKTQHDSRNATFVRYETLVDRHARQRNAPPVFEKQTFYGRLQHIFVVRIPSHPAFSLVEPTVVFLAAILPCPLDHSPSRLKSLDIHLCGNIGTSLDIVDIVCVQCLVGRVPLDGAGGRKWAIIDRSGNLARAVFED